jgi:hypothetical protein
MFGALAALVAGEAAAAAKRKALAAAFYAAAAVLIAFALGYALSALRTWLLLAYGLPYPELWIAVGLVILAAPLILLGVRKQREKPQRDIIRTAALIAAPAAIRVTSRTVSPQLVMIVTIASLGLMIGRRLRRP